MFQLHNKCVSSVRAECGLGEHAVHILPPTAICPVVLDRQKSLQKRGSKYGHDNVICYFNLIKRRAKR